MLSNLLSTSSKKKVNLIEYLSEVSVASKSDITNFLGIDLPSLIRIVNDINDSSNAINILQEKKELKLTFNPAHNITSVYAEILKNDYAFIILETLFHKNFSSYEALAEEVFISRSSLIRSIKKINEILAPYDIGIKSNPLRIVGSETSIVQFFSIFFLEKYNSSLFPMEEQFYFHVKTLLTNFEKLSFKKLHFSDIKRFSTAIYVRYIRERNQIHLTNNNNFPKKLRATSSISKNSHFGHNFDFTENLDKILSQYNLLEKYETFQHSKENQYLIDLFNNFFEFFKLDKKLLDSKLEEISFNFSVGKNLKVPYFILNNKFKRFRDKSNNTFEVIAGKLKELYFESQISNKSEDESNYIYYLLCTFFPNIDLCIVNQLDNLGILLLLDTDLQHSNYLKLKILSMSRFNLAIEEFTSSDFFTEPNLKFTPDIIISNMPKDITQTLTQHTNSCYLCIDVSLNLEAVSLINITVDQIISQKIKNTFQL